MNKSLHNLFIVRPVFLFQRVENALSPEGFSRTQETPH
jgi:hypothetical protein